MRKAIALLAIFFSVGSFADTQIQFMSYLWLQTPHLAVRMARVESVLATHPKGQQLESLRAEWTQIDAEATTIAEAASEYLRERTYISIPPNKRVTDKEVGELYAHIKAINDKIRAASGQAPLIVFNHGWAQRLSRSNSYSTHLRTFPEAELNRLGAAITLLRSKDEFTREELQQACREVEAGAKNLSKVDDEGYRYDYNQLLEELKKKLN